MEEEKALYEKRVRKALESFLSSDYLNYNPYDRTDAQIIRDAENRSNVSYDGGSTAWMQSFASIYTIENFDDGEYKDRNTQLIRFKPTEGLKTILQSLNSFVYPSSLFTGKLEFDKGLAKYVSTIDDSYFSSKTNVRKHFEGMLGQRCLIAYTIQAVTKFGTATTCYRIYSLNGDDKHDAEIIRQQVLKSKAWYLNLIAKFPALAMPTRNFEGIRPFYVETTIKVVQEYMPDLLKKLRETENTLYSKECTFEQI